MTTKEAAEIAKGLLEKHYHEKGDCKEGCNEAKALSRLISIAERVDEGKILDILEENTKEQKGGMGNYCGCSITSIGEATKQIVSYLEGR